MTRYRVALTTVVEVDAPDGDVTGAALIATLALGLNHSTFEGRLVDELVETVTINGRDVPANAVALRTRPDLVALVPDGEGTRYGAGYGQLYDRDAVDDES